MQDPDIPPREEGDTNGAVGVVRQDAARAALWPASEQEHQGIFTAPMDHSYRANMNGGNGNGSRDRDGPVFRPRIRWSIPSLFPRFGRMRFHAYSLSWKTCFS